MFFTDREKQIYVPPGATEGTAYDPLALDNYLTYLSGGRLAEWVDMVNRGRAKPGEELGDVSPDGKAKSKADGAMAELELAKIARQAFSLPQFPECLDAQALEWLYDFLGWLEKKE